MYAMKRGESHAGPFYISLYIHRKRDNPASHRKAAGNVEPYEAGGKLPEALSASYTDRAQVRTLSQYWFSPFAITFAAVMVH